MTVIPDGDDGGEQHDEPGQVAEPLSHEALQGDHDERQHHLGQEQGLGEPVQLQVQQPHLQGPETQVSVLRTAGGNWRETQEITALGFAISKSDILFCFASIQSRTSDRVK